MVGFLKFLVLMLVFVSGMSGFLHYEYPDLGYGDLILPVLMAAALFLRLQVARRA